MSGTFITFEGIEGVGKTTQARAIFKLLDAARPAGCLLTREPGGTDTGEGIRALMLQEAGARMDGITETLLVFAARRAHIQQVIRPALDAGRIVLCDRFTDATFAYQGGGREVDMQTIATLQELAQDGLNPDLTLLLDAPEDIGLARIRARGRRDRFEQEDIAFFQRVRRAYLERAACYPERLRILDATLPVDTLTRSIWAILTARGVC